MCSPSKTPSNKKSSKVGTLMKKASAIVGRKPVKPIVVTGTKHSELVGQPAILAIGTANPPNVWTKESFETFYGDLDKLPQEEKGCSPEFTKFLLARGEDP